MRKGIAKAGGFTLIEVLLVLVILMLLVGAVVVFVLPQQAGAQRNTTELKLRDIDRAIQTFTMQVGRPPTEEEGLDALVSMPDFESDALRSRWTGPYIDEESDLVDAWGNEIRYEMREAESGSDEMQGRSRGRQYRLFSVGPDGEEGTDDDIEIGRSRDAE